MFGSYTQTLDLFSKGYLTNLNNTYFCNKEFNVAMQSESMEKNLLFLSYMSTCGGAMEPMMELDSMQEGVGNTPGHSMSETIEEHLPNCVVPENIHTHHKRFFSKIPTPLEIPIKLHTFL